MTPRGQFELLLRRLITHETCDQRYRLTPHQIGRNRKRIISVNIGSASDRELRNNHIGARKRVTPFIGDTTLNNGFLRPNKARQQKSTQSQRKQALKPPSHRSPQFA